MFKADGTSIPTRPSFLGRLKSPEDDATWQQFFDRYWKLIYEVALRSGLTETEAQDVVQETVITVAKKIGSFEYNPAQGSFKGWLLTITRCRIVDEFRKRPRFQTASIHAPADDSVATSTVDRIPDERTNDLEGLWDEEWRKNLMDVAVERVKRQVKARHFQVFELSVLRNWSAHEIAKALSLNIGQVYLTKHRLVKLIKSEVKSLESKVV
jgi:RNA polymerase sigma factor (sigma-70 family)